MKEFNLSEKIYDIDTCPIFSDERRVINVFHIKEFIKLLNQFKRVLITKEGDKEEIWINFEEFENNLKNIAGEQLK